MSKSSIFTIIALLACFLGACGGGGGGTDPNPNPNPQPTTAIVKLATTVTGSVPAGTTIGGYDLTIGLPAGVTVKSSTPPETDTGVVTATGEGAGSYIVSTYTAATSTSSGSLRIILVSPNANGINAGEFSTVTCNVAAGVHPTSADFTTTAFLASGLVTTPTSSTVDLTSQLTLFATATIQ